jgi:hypothetical protein
MYRTDQTRTANGGSIRLLAHDTPQYFVLSHEDEYRNLAAALEPLRNLATVFVDAPPMHLQS